MHDPIPEPAAEALPPLPGRAEVHDETCCMTGSVRRHGPHPDCPGTEATLPPLPQRRRHTCTREQLTGALAHAQAATTMIGPPAAGSYSAKVFAGAVLSQLPLLGADLIAVPAEDLLAVLRAAHAFLDAATFNRVAGLAGMTRG